ncbi:hypothetical protein MKW94_025630 [Papaver nudicaule]|uniref:DYW domain-containing protein n=1 Tax=Papaver nudicaule TaxID=74823 RepID=A0AA41S5X4_PAPNU|nr:hypothetical protein [Papaver nudicaule]
MERKTSTVMRLLPKVVRRNSKSNLTSTYINFCKTFRTVSAAAHDYPTQHNNNSFGGLEGGRGDFQKTTGGGGGFQNRTQNHYRGNPNDYVQNNPNRFYQNVSHKTPNSSSYYQNTDNNFRGFQQNSNGHYRRNNSAPRGPNEFSSRTHPQKPNGHPQTVKNVNNGQFQQNQNGLHSEMNNGESVSKVKCNGTLEDMDGFCNEGNVKEAMRVLNLLYQQGIDIGLSRYCQLMKLIGEVAAKEEAKLIHNHLMKAELYSEITVQNKVLEMYLKCGLISDAHDWFGIMPARNLTSWDTMIVGLAENGCGEDAIDVFTEFKGSGGTPDGQMFLGVFYACSTLCDINEGMVHFESMSKVFGITPSMDHYVGVVSMLGSAGYLDEAFEFIENMPVEPSIDVWETLMVLCRIHGKLETGDLCANVVAGLDPSRLSAEAKAGFVPVNPSDHAIAEKRKKYLAQIRQKHLGLQNKVDQFRTGDTSHPDNDKIYRHLETLSAHMKEFGYMPELRLAMHDVEDECKATSLLAHSEKLACISGLLSSPARSQMRIVKNIKVCVDCHNALKIISKIVGRRILIRGNKTWHHFEDGACSCKDAIWI